MSNDRSIQVNYEGRQYKGVDEATAPFHCQNCQDRGDSTVRALTYGS